MSEELRIDSKLRFEKPCDAQPATFEPENATPSLTDAQLIALKAAALKVLRRNKGRNQGATDSETGRNSGRNSGGNYEGSAQLEIEGEMRIRAIAEQYGYPLESLLDWYRDDLDILGEMPMEAAVLTVQDYVERYLY